MKAKIGLIIMSWIIGGVVFELLKIVLAYPIGALSGVLDVDPESAMGVDSGLSGLIALAVMGLLIASRWKKLGTVKEPPRIDEIITGPAKG